MLKLVLKLKLKFELRHCSDYLSWGYLNTTSRQRKPKTMVPHLVIFLKKYIIGFSLAALVQAFDLIRLNLVNAWALPQAGLDTKKIQFRFGEVLIWPLHSNIHKLWFKHVNKFKLINANCLTSSQAWAQAQLKFDAWSIRAQCNSKWYKYLNGMSFHLKFCHY